MCRLALFQVVIALRFNRLVTVVKSPYLLARCLWRSEIRLAKLGRPGAIAKHPPQAFDTSLNQPPSHRARDAQRSQGVIQKKERGRKREEPAIRRGRDEKTRRKEAQLPGARFEQPRAEDDFARDLQSGRTREVKLLRERAARRARVVPRRQRAGKKRPGGKGLDRRIEKSSTRREATLDGAFPREAPGFLLHFLPIHRPGAV